MTRTLPPRCIDHRDYQRGCTTCLVYGRAVWRRRARLRAYDQWNPLTDTAPSAEHLRMLMAAGMSVRQIAFAAGVAYNPALHVLRGKQARVLTVTAQRLLRVQPPHSSAIGVARRLRALATIGYGIRHLNGHAQLSRATLTSLRTGVFSAVSPPIHSRIAELYEQLFATSGPSDQARVLARGRGWEPPEAWTDATIDNPDALPYSDLEAQAYVDEVKLARARLPANHPSRVPFTDLAYAEQRTLFQEHLETSRSWRVFAARYRAPRTAPREVSIRWRAAMRQLKAEFQEALE